MLAPNIPSSSWHNVEPGTGINRLTDFIPDCEFTAVVGALEYRRNVENYDSEGGHVLAAEYELFSSRLLGTEKEENNHPAIACRGVKDPVCECRKIHNTGSMVV